MPTQKKHIGQELERAIANSQIPKARIAHLMEINRRTLDTLLEKEVVPVKYVAKLAKILRLDFTALVPELTEYLNERKDFPMPSLAEDATPYQSAGLAECIKEKREWEKKYYDQLERENAMYRNVLVQIFGALNLKPGPGVNLEGLRG